LRAFRRHQGIDAILDIVEQHEENTGKLRKHYKMPCMQAATAGADEDGVQLRDLERPRYPP
jgi:hypothetical protein